MSWAATAWVKRMRISPTTGELISKGEKLVLFVLSDYHNEERGDAWASLRFLAQESLHSRSGVVRTLRRLEEKGVLVVVRDAEATTKRLTNRYRFVGLDVPVPVVASTSITVPIAPVDNSVSAPECLGVTSDPMSPGLVTSGHQASDLRSPGLVTSGHHIFPKNLSNESFQKHSVGLSPDAARSVNQQAEEVLQALNATACRRYLGRHPNGEPTANLQLITALLRKGYTSDQLVAVVEDRVRRWKDDPERREYLRPETLFGPKKFSQYLGQVGLARAPTPSAYRPMPRQARDECTSPPMDFREMIEQTKAG